MDCKLRLWYIPHKRVSVSNEIDSSYGVLTATSFCKDGRMIAVGTYEGRCLFYNSEGLQYHTQIFIKRSNKKRGKKISAIVPIEGTNKILVTSNDSRIRMYDLNDFSLLYKFKGAVHNSSQIRASLNQDASYVICGSENNNFYIWSLKTPKASTMKDVIQHSKRVCEYFEAYNAHDETVTVALFAPHSTYPAFLTEDKSPIGELIIAADIRGNIKILLNLSFKF
jgi:WD40 repeat protein